MAFKLCPACANEIPRDYIEEYHTGISRELCAKHKNRDLEEESNKLDSVMEDLEPFGRNQGRINGSWN